MANTLISMHKLKQILRLYVQSKGTKFISYQTGVARNTVKKYIRIFCQAKLTYSEVSSMTDQQLLELFGKPPLNPEPSKKERELLAFFPYMDKELRKTGMTRELLWKEYLTRHEDGYRYTRFCTGYTKWTQRLSPVMRMVHKAGDKMFVDFAGEKLYYVDTETGEIRPAEVFVAILGCSQLTYAEACLSQQKEDFIIACENALHYFGGVPQAVVPDNLKSAVTKSSKYEPTLNQAFEDFADHYQFTVLPARAYRPRDKSLVEGAVKILYSRIYANVPKEPFTSLRALNEWILQYVHQHNTALMKGRNYSRLEQYQEIERKAMQPLPALRYEFKHQTMVTVMKNGHVCLGEDKHYYSVPYKFIGCKVKVIYSASMVEVYYRYERIATHQRLRSPYNYTTQEEHLASKHRFVSEWTPEKFLSWAQAIGPDVRMLIEKILDKKQYYEQSYKSCVGVLGFEKKVGKERLNRACRRALDYGHHNYKIVQSILEKGMDQYDDQDAPSINIPSHDNIRGENYYN